MSEKPSIFDGSLKSEMLFEMSAPVTYVAPLTAYFRTWPVPADPDLAAPDPDLPAAGLLTTRDPSFAEGFPFLILLLVALLLTLLCIHYCAPSTAAGSLETGFLRLVPLLPLMIAGAPRPITW